MKSTRNIKVSIYLNFSTIDLYGRFKQFLKIVLKLHYASDLPPDTKLEDMDKLAGFDLRTLPNVEETGESCVRKIQEYMLHDLSSKEAAILPEDKLQKLAVGVCILKYSYSSSTSLQTRVSCSISSNFYELKFVLFFF